MFYLFYGESISLLDILMAFIILFHGKKKANGRFHFHSELLGVRDTPESSGAPLARFQAVLKPGPGF